MNELYEAVSKLQNEKRYRHTLGVIATAKQLASVYHIDASKCELAALLHDVTKQLDIEAQGPYLKQIDDQFVKDSLPLWHSFTGSIYARDVLGITDTDVLDAIKYHTVGKADASSLSQVIYLADYLEPGRTLEEAEAFRSLIGVVSLDSLYRQVAKARIDYELSVGHQLHPLTKELYESII